MFTGDIDGITDNTDKDTKNTDTLTDDPIDGIDDILHGGWL